MIRRELTICNLDIDERFFSASFFGAGLGSAELIIRQYLLVRIGEVDINRALLGAAGKSGGKVILAMPAQWISVIERNGFEVNRFLSSALWVGYIIAAYFYGFFTTIKILITSLKSILFRGYRSEIKTHVYFHALTINNISQAQSDRIPFNIVSWYLQWQGKKSGVKAIHHNVRNATQKCIGDVDVIEQTGPLPILSGLREFACYSGWALTALVYSAFDILRARWWHAFLLNQAALAAQARVVPSDYLAREYLFHNTGLFYHPLWTYEVENRGSTVSLYFYSSNCEGFKRTGELTPLNYGWAAINWPRYLVWDQGQANHIQRAAGVNAKVEIVGPIWFSDSVAEMPCLPLRSIAVFDVQPFRSSYYQSLAPEFDYYKPNVANQFLFDIRETLKNINCYMAHKRKREIGKSVHPHYTLAIKELELSTNYIRIDPDHSALSLIQKCDVVISMPYTSTALLARHADKPSIYYDPSGLLQKDDPAAHGILIIQDKDELANWLDLHLVSDRDAS